MTEIAEQKAPFENRIHITTTISPVFKKWLDDNHIKVSDALARGVNVLMGGNSQQNIILKENKELYEDIGKLQEKVRVLALKNIEIEKKLFEKGANL